MSWIHEHTFKLAATPVRVFAALTEPAQLRKWFSEHVDVDPRPGGIYQFWGKHTLGCPDRADAGQRIMGMERNELLAFSWRLLGIDTSVTMALAADGEGSALALRHAVAADLPTPRQRELIDDLWRLSMANLAAHLAGGAAVLLPDYSDPAPEVRHVVMIDAPRDAVFRALIEPELINQWFGTTSAVVDPRAGGRYDLRWTYQVDGRDVDGGPTQILEFVPNERLVLDWPDWRGDKSVTGQRIAFYLETAGAGTKLTFVHSGFGRTVDMGDYGFGWVYFLRELKKVVSGLSESAPPLR